MTTNTFDLDMTIKHLEALQEDYEKQRIRLRGLDPTSFAYHEMDSFVRGLNVALGVVTTARKNAVARDTATVMPKSRKSQMPKAVEEYVRKYHPQISSARDVWIVQTFYPSKGWAPLQGYQRISKNKLRNLKQQGITCVGFQVTGSPRVFDFQMAELGV